MKSLFIKEKIPQLSRQSMRILLIHEKRWIQNRKTEYILTYILSTCCRYVLICRLHFTGYSGVQVNRKRGSLSLDHSYSKNRISSSRLEVKSENTKHNWSLLISENSHQTYICFKKTVPSRSSDTSKLSLETKDAQEKIQHSNSCF